MNLNGNKIALGVVSQRLSNYALGKFDNGKQVGEWTTYDKQGKVYKVTNMKNAK